MPPGKICWTLWFSSMITRILRSWPSPAAELAVGWVLALPAAAEAAAAVPAT